MGTSPPSRRIRLHPRCRSASSGGMMSSTRSQIRTLRWCSGGLRLNILGNRPSMASCVQHQRAGSAIDKLGVSPERQGRKTDGGGRAVLRRVGIVRLSLASLMPFRTIKGEANAQTDCGSLRDCSCTHRSLTKGADMRKRLVCLVLLGVTIAAKALYDSGKALATEAKGYKSTSLALGHFQEIEVSSTFPRDQKTAGDEPAWQSLQQTKGLSDVYVQNNTWAP